MRTVKIVGDSAANLMELTTVAFDAAPLEIITGQREDVDGRNLDLNEMIAYFKPGKVQLALCQNESAANTLTGWL